MKSVGVLMTVHNRKDNTLRCLENLYNQESTVDYSFKVFLTDDGCTDGTPEAVLFKYHQVNVIKGDGSLFWNRGMWTAWEEAAKYDYDYYLWLNDDTYLYPNALQLILESSSDNKDNCIIVGSTQSTDHTKITYGGYTKDRKIVIPNGNLQKIHHFNGNIVLIPRQVYQILGNLDYRFTHSNGDIDYGLRANVAGISSYITGYFLGECDRHVSLERWCNPSISLNERLKALNKPNGMPPREKFYLQRKHQNLFIASFHYCTIYLRCLIPQLWNLKNEKNTSDF